MFLYTLWARSVALFHYCISRLSKFDFSSLTSFALCSSHYVLLHYIMFMHLCSMFYVLVVWGIWWQTPMYSHNHSYLYISTHIYDKYAQTHTHIHTYNSPSFVTHGLTQASYNYTLPLHKVSPPKFYFFSQVRINTLQTDQSHAHKSYFFHIWYSNTGLTFETSLPPR